MIHNQAAIHYTRLSVAVPTNKNTNKQKNDAAFEIGYHITESAIKGILKL